MKITLAIFALAASINAAQAMACLPFDEGEWMVLNGTASKWKGKGEGGINEKALVLSLDAPICFKGNRENAVTIINLSPQGRRQVLHGDHATVAGCMVAGDGWAIDVRCKK